jgi:hypothetical protein
MFWFVRCWHRAPSALENSVKSGGYGALLDHNFTHFLMDCCDFSFSKIEHSHTLILWHIFWYLNIFFPWWSVLNSYPDLFWTGLFWSLFHPCSLICGGFLRNMCISVVLRQQKRRQKFQVWIVAIITWMKSPFNFPPKSNFDFLLYF